MIPYLFISDQQCYFLVNMYTSELIRLYYHFILPYNDFKNIQKVDISIISSQKEVTIGKNHLE